MTGPTDPTPAAPRQTLAMRLAERERQRAERAERLARLRPGPDLAADLAADPGSDPGSDPAAPALPEAGDAEAALEAFLRALTGEAAPVPASGAGPAAEPMAEPAAVLPFQRPEPAPATDLDRLPGAGPGLVDALRRAGIDRLADLAPLAPEALAARLGPIGRLVPAARWIATAREAAPTA